MWSLGRLLARIGVMGGPSRSRGPDADFRTYGRRLNADLTQLAQALLWATPLATPGTSRDEATVPNQLARLRAARVALHRLLKAACQHQPPARPDSTPQTSAHDQYLDVVKRSIAALDCLEPGLATADEGAVRLASAELRDLASAAADLHAQVIEWALPLLLGPE